MILRDITNAAEKEYNYVIRCKVSLHGPHNYISVRAVAKELH